MKTKILHKAILVEDSNIIARDIKHHLMDFGYEVIAVFPSGEEFLISENDLKYDFVIMDIILEGNLNGIETIKNLYLIKQKPVLFLTATEDENIINEAKILNPLGYLLKPYTPAQLKITFDMAIQRWFIDQELENYKDHLEELIAERTRELKEAKEEAVRSEKLKTAFIHNISHEIRTPLNVIIGFTELLINPKISDLKKNEFVKYIQDSTSSLLTLVDNVWQLSHIQIGQTKPVITKTYINEILDTILFELKQILFKKKIKVEVILEKTNQNSDFFIYSDPTIIKRILQNLGHNAAKYTTSGSIVLSYVVKNQMLILSVEDTGIGISDENLTNIFDTFYKEETSGNVLFRGAGLGLSLTKSLVELLNGKINVKSELGKGTCFTIELPLNPRSERNKNLAFIDVSWPNNYKEIFKSKKVNIQYFQSLDEFYNTLKTGASFELIFLNVKSKSQGKEDIDKIRKAIVAKIICLGSDILRTWLEKEKNSGRIFNFLIKPLDNKAIVDLFFS